MTSSQRTPLKAMNGIVPVVIIGGGPTGLLSALLLEKKFQKMHVKGEFTIVEKHAPGEYLRSGDYVEEVFQEFGDALGCKIKKSYANHIKDMERTLYGDHVLESKDIKYFCGTYITYLNGHAYIEGYFVDKDEEKQKHKKKQTDQKPELKKHIIPCSLLIDCSGARSQAVIHEINQRHKTATVFEKKIIGNNPFGKFLHATFLMDTGSEAYKEFCKGSRKFDSAYRNNMQMLEKLGWKNATYPDGYINQYGGLSKHIKTTPKIKLHCYSEIPEHLEEKDVLPWVEIFMRVTSGMSSPIKIEKPHVSRTYPQKKWYDIFNVVPHYTCPFYYLDVENSIVIVPLGDASFTNLFFFGKGLRRAGKQILKLIENIDSVSGSVVVDLKTFATWSELDLKKRIHSIENEFEKRHTQLHMGKMLKLTKLYQDGLKYLDGIMGQTRDQSVSLLKEALEYADEDSPLSKQDIQQALFDLENGGGEIIMKKRIQSILKNDTCQCCYGLSGALMKTFDHAEEFHALVMQQFEHDTISFECALQLNQLQLENKTTSMKTSDFIKLIHDGQWRSLFNMKDQDANFGLLRQLFILRDMAIKEGWDSIANSNIHLCSMAHEKLNFSLTSYIGSFVTKCRMRFFPVSHASEADAVNHELQKMKTFQRS